MNNSEAKIQKVLKIGPASVSDIMNATDLSQGTVAKYLRENKNFIQINNNRPPLYATTREKFGNYEEFPIFSVDADGHFVYIGDLLPLAHGGYKVNLMPGSPKILNGYTKHGLFDDLPFFLQDLRPQGFMGRQIAKELSKRGLGFPGNCEKWNASHIGKYLLANGNDLPGNIVLGHENTIRIRIKPSYSNQDDYPRLAKAADSGERPGSSAGGEQPKFATFNGQRGRHVIVKFSPFAESDVAERWRDILVTEHIAAKTLRRINLPAAKTRLHEIDGQVFLESDRLDRINEYGRRPMLSLECVDAEFVGHGEDWCRVVKELVAQKLMGEQGLHEALFLQNFGTMIYNDDMHLGNLSLRYEGSIFTLLPVYDMCCMGFRPKSSGITEPYNHTIKTPALPYKLNQVSQENLKIAVNRFWEAVLDHDLTSSTFKAFIYNKTR